MPYGTYDYNSPTGNNSSWQQASGSVGQGGAYSQFNYSTPQTGTGIDLAALQNANRYGGNNVGQQQGGGSYSGYDQQGQVANNPYRTQGISPQQGIGGTLNNPYSQFQGHSNFAYPGETGAQTAARLQQEYTIRGDTALNPAGDAQRRLDQNGVPIGLSQDQYAAGPGGGGAAGGGSWGGSGGGAWGDPAEIELRRQREIALQRIDDQREYYNSDSALELQNNMRNQMIGVNSPFPALTTAQLGENSDAAGSAFDREQQMARRYGAGSGQSGGGAEYNAIRNAGRQADVTVGSGRRQIQTTNALHEDQRRERARNEATSYLQNMADNAWRSTAAETGLRSRLQIVGGGGMGSGLGGGGDMDSQNQTAFQTSGGVSYDPNSGFQYNQQSGNGSPNPGYANGDPFRYAS